MPSFLLFFLALRGLCQQLQVLIRRRLLCMTGLPLLRRRQLCIRHRVPREQLMCRPHWRHSVNDRMPHVVHIVPKLVAVLLARYVVHWVLATVSAGIGIDGRLVQRNSSVFKPVVKVVEAVGHVVVCIVSTGCLVVMICRNRDGGVSRGERGSSSLCHVVLLSVQRLQRAARWSPSLPCFPRSYYIICRGYSYPFSRW